MPPCPHKTVMLFAAAVGLIPLIAGLATAHRMARRGAMPRARRCWGLAGGGLATVAVYCALTGAILWLIDTV